MRIAFHVNTGVVGGLTNAALRLASALAERNHVCEVLVPMDGDVAAMMRSAMPGEVDHDRSGLVVRRCPSAGAVQEFENFAPSVIIATDPAPSTLRSFRRLAPTLFHAHNHAVTCSCGSRYWTHMKRECQVRAGVKCAALRPFLGCGSYRDALRIDGIAAQEALLRLIVEGEVGCLAISSRQSEILHEHGVPESGMTEIPNLGMRLSPNLLAEAGSVVPAASRGQAVFIGRLSKEKGAPQLIEAAAALTRLSGSRSDRLCVYGSGYLESQVVSASGLEFRGEVPQREVGGIMMWARGLAFPSMWPEPGGIVGIDALLFGVPVGAFRVGAPLDWPGVRLFERNESRDLLEWVMSLPVPQEMRTPRSIAHRMDQYWGYVAGLAETRLREYASTGRFSGSPPKNPVRDALEFAHSGSEDGTT